jgi:hypothetical protein
LNLTQIYNLFNFFLYFFYDFKRISLLKGNHYKLSKIIISLKVIIAKLIIVTDYFVYFIIYEKLKLIIKLCLQQILLAESIIFPKLIKLSTTFLKHSPM